MRLVLIEAKKILLSWQALIISILSAVFFFAVIVPADFNSFCASDSGVKDIYTVVHESYGDTVSPEEMAECENMLTSYYAPIFEQALQADEEFSRTGIITYEQFRELRMKQNVNNCLAQGYDQAGLEGYDENKDYSITEEEKMLDMPLMQEEGMLSEEQMKLHLKANVALGELYDVDFITSSYDSVHKAGDLKKYYTTINFNDRQLKRVKEIYASDEINSCTSKAAVEGFSGAVAKFAMMMVVSVCALLAPCITRDKGNIELIQYTSKAGRGLLSKKFAAMLISGAVLVLLQSVLFAVYLMKSTVPEFFSCGMNSFYYLTYRCYWFKGTFLQYILAVFAVAYVFVFVACAAMFIVSKFSKDYISLLMKAIPVCAALTLLGNCAILYAFTAFRAFFRFPVIPIPYIEVWLTLALLAVSLPICLKILHKHKIADIAV